jgi:hypothetical protein
MQERDLNAIIDRFERLSQDPEREKHMRQALAHEIDDFLKGFARDVTPRHHLEKAERALAKCNLPLTNCIFHQESRLAARIWPKSSLGILPSIAISIVSQKKTLKSVSTQWNGIDHDRTERLAKKMLNTLKVIREDVVEIAERHERHKRKRREMKLVLGCNNYTDSGSQIV